jgi:hypothetical protein
LQGGVICFHLVPVVWPRVDQEPKADDAWFKNRGGLASYVKENSFINGIFVPREHEKSNSDQDEDASQALHKVINGIHHFLILNACGCVFINTMMAR